MMPESRDALLELGPRREILQHDVLRAVIEAAALIAVTFVVPMRDRRAAAFDEKIVEERDFRARGEAAMERSKKADQRPR